MGPKANTYSSKVQLFGGRRRLDRAGFGAEVPEAPPDDPESSHHRHRKKHPCGASDLAASEDAEDHQAGVELDPAPHDQGTRHVVLREAPRQDEQGQKPGVREPAEERYRDDDGASDEWPEDRQELERAAERREDQGVRDASQ